MRTNKRVSPILYPAISTSLTLFDSKELNYLGNKLSTKFGNNWQGGKGNRKGKWEKNKYFSICMFEWREEKRERTSGEYHKWVSYYNSFATRI